MNFDIAEVLTCAWQITWKHKIVWVFSMFPFLLSFLFVPIVFIPMFFIGPNSLINKRFVDEPYYVSLFLATNLFLFVLSILLYPAGAATTLVGILRVENGQQRLSVLTLAQDISPAYLKSTFLVIYLRPTRPTVMQTALQ